MFELLVTRCIGQSQGTLSDFSRQLLASLCRQLQVVSRQAEEFGKAVSSMEEAGLWLLPGSDPAAAAEDAKVSSDGSEAPVMVAPWICRGDLGRAYPHSPIGLEYTLSLWVQPASVCTAVLEDGTSAAEELDEPGPQEPDVEEVDDSSVVCASRHRMQRLTERPEYYRGTIICDQCRMTDLAGGCPFFYHCRQCTYDLCHNCATRMMTTKVRGGGASEKAPTSGSVWLKGGSVQGDESDEPWQSFGLDIDSSGRLVYKMALPKGKTFAVRSSKPLPPKGGGWTHLAVRQSKEQVRAPSGMRVVCCSARRSSPFRAQVSSVSVVVAFLLVFGFLHVFFLGAWIRGEMVPGQSGPRVRLTVAAVRSGAPLHRRGEVRRSRCPTSARTVRLWFWRSRH